MMKKSYWIESTVTQLRVPEGEALKKQDWESDSLNLSQPFAISDNGVLCCCITRSCSIVSVFEDSRDDPEKLLCMHLFLCTLLCKEFNKNTNQPKLSQLFSLCCTLQQHWKWFLWVCRLQLPEARNCIKGSKSAKWTNNPIYIQNLI